MILFIHSFYFWFYHKDIVSNDANQCEWRELRNVYFIGFLYQCHEVHFVVWMLKNMWLWRLWCWSSSFNIFYLWGIFCQNMAFSNNIYFIVSHISNSHRRISCSTAPVSPCSAVMQLLHVSTHNTAPDIYHILTSCNIVQSLHGPNVCAQTKTFTILSRDN